MGKIKDRYFKEINSDDDNGYDKYLEEEQIARGEAEQHVMSAFNRLKGNHEKVFHALDFHKAIWEASTEILPHLEVQVVIDAKNDCFVSTGSAGFVDFGSIPKGMRMPVKCWIHTHPFGSAYFSGTDIRTVSIWQQLMESAYVLGGIGHYGFWSNDKANQLDIFRENEFERTQTWNQYGNEEE